MDRITINVKEEIAKAWRNSSDKRKSELNSLLSVILEKSLKEKEIEDFIQLLNEIRQEASEKGLTQDTLDSLLNERG